jgi:hypothetical protein
MADIKPSVYTVLMVLAIVLVGVPVLKIIGTRWAIPGFSELVKAI